tara:strand:- start:189 stop:782 length:594 start_codon:yes stop_codon:yes gene_type:complete
MTKQFKSLILYPTIFIVIFFGVAIADKSIPAYLIFLLVIFEQIYSWNESLENNQDYDFRIFFTSQYLNIIYTLILLPVYIISAFFWEQIHLWILFGYGLNYIIFRSIAKVGTDQLSQTNFSRSNEIKSTLNLWKSNKRRLSTIISKTSDNVLKEKLKDRLNYSSFLNSEEASFLLDEAENANEKELDQVLSKISELM